ncbi:unnamed protein product [Dovyalis caffra]|uniref:DUF4220 domain-containing protein n=1 Tax=Dovyalis caffra TaxID=77055 RepID=A0AAV1S7X7_9ROSI|nr:unnamed protein product [Dovyalis caffra]
MLLKVGYAAPESAQDDETCLCSCHSSMIPAVVSSLIYIKGRRNMELVPSELKKLWKEWELSILVLLSLVLQIALIFFGNRRKATSRTRIWFLLWCAYLMADWVATVAPGVLLNKLGEATKDMGRRRVLNVLHLGGPDTISAQSAVVEALSWISSPNLSCSLHFLYGLERLSSLHS